MFGNKRRNSKAKRKAPQEIKPNTFDLHFHVTEAYKTARTNINFSVIKKGCKIITFLSSLPSEGKSTTAINVAIALSKEVNTKVLIIDCDLRKPVLHRFLNIESAHGLSNYFSDNCPISDIIKKTRFEQLDAITCGMIVPNPSELLGSDTMKELIADLAKIYDFIIIDTPPINVVSDALPLIKLSDGAVFVVKENYSLHPEFMKSIETLERINAKLLGVILNGSSAEVKGGYKNRYSYSYGAYKQVPSKDKDNEKIKDKKKQKYKKQPSED